MTPEELGHFLATVRQKSFVDYLDPMGETAQAALDRRIRWATMSRRDPAHAEEAEFILKNEAALKQTILDELLSGGDDWLEDDDTGEDSWGVNNWGGAPPNKKKPVSTQAPVALKPTAPESGLTRLEDLTDPPSPPRIKTPKAAAASSPNDVGDLEVRHSSYSNSKQNPDSSGGQQDVGWSAWDDSDDESAKDKLADQYVVDDTEPDDTPPSHAREQPAPPPLPRNYRRQQDDDDDVTPDTAGPRTALDIRGSRKPDEKALAARDKALRSTENNEDSKAGRWLVFPAIILLLVGSFVVLYFVPSLQGGDDTDVAAVVEVPKPAPVVVEEPDPVVEDGTEVADGTAALDGTEAADGTDAADGTETADAGQAKNGNGSTASATPGPSPSSQPRPSSITAPSPSPSPTPKPDPAPVPKPDPAPVATPVPPPAPAPTPVPEEGTYPTVTGNWSGIAAGKSIELVVESQNGGSFAGTVRLMNVPGEYDSFSVLGKVKVDKSISFTQTGGGPSFYGTVGGIQIKGTATLPDQEPGKLSLIK